MESMALDPIFQKNKNLYNIESVMQSFDTFTESELYTELYTNLMQNPKNHDISDITE